jgi:hypothetical protein
MAAIFGAMVINKIKALAAAKAHVAQLEQSISCELSRELAGLSAAYGFGDVDSFIDAVKGATGKKRGRGPGRPAGEAAPKKNKRAKITDAIRAKVKKLVKAGKTGSHIAKALKISLPSVQNIKKALGLVRKSKKSASKPAARGKSAKRSAPAKSPKKRTSPKKPSAPDAKPSEAQAESAPAAST